MKAKFMSCLLAIAMLGMLPSWGNAQLYSSCDQWASYSTNGYIIYNNIWGSGAGTQCLTVNAYNNWYVDANHSQGSGGVKSYPNVTKDVNLMVDNMGSVTSTFSVTRPSGGSYSSTYDIWYNNYAYEIMLWMNYTGAVGPIADSYNCGGACPSATNVSIGGHTWNVYRGNNGSNAVFSFLRTSNTNSGTVDITAISQWLRNNGWFGNVNLHRIQFGFEITGTSGTQRYSVTNFSVTTGGGGGTTYYKFQNRATGLYIDGMGRTSNGSNCGQYSGGSSYNQQWVMETVGSYVKLRNRGTGLYLDGMGRTSNGSVAGQWASSSSYNQQWTRVISGSYSRLQNRATGLYIDGMGRTSNGSDLGQWGNSSSNNQQWSVSTVLGKESVEESEVAAPELPSRFSLNQNYPNPFNPETQIAYELKEAGFVRIEIVDLLGRKVRTLVNENIAAGFHQVRWNATSDEGMPVPSGMYLYTMKVVSGAETFSESKKMFLVK